MPIEHSRNQLYCNTTVPEAPENIPVPVDDDDDLFCDAFHLEKTKHGGLKSTSTGGTLTCCDMKAGQ